jgi:tRNA pseudouridine38-40 synthase
LVTICLVIEYDGQGFSGWQIQPGQRTVQGELHRVLEMVLRQPIAVVHSSGRTDAGVHARRQVVHFHVETPPPDFIVFRRSISSLLRGEVAVLSAEIESDEFHSRRSAIKKQYSYRILHRDTPPVLDKGYVWYIPVELAIARMQEEAAAVIGTHDFKSFQGADCHARSSVKTIYESEWIWDDPYLTYRVVGSGFLKHMVRILVGTFVDIGKQPDSSASMTAILSAQSRLAAGVTAPPYGLFLDYVEYPEGPR